MNAILSGIGVNTSAVGAIVCNTRVPERAAGSAARNAELKRTPCLTYWSLTVVPAGRFSKSKTVRVTCARGARKAHPAIRIQPFDALVHIEPVRIVLFLTELSNSSQELLALELP